MDREALAIIILSGQVGHSPLNKWWLAFLFASSFQRTIDLQK